MNDEQKNNSIVTITPNMETPQTSKTPNENNNIPGSNSIPGSNLSPVGVISTPSATPVSGSVGVANNNQTPQSLSNENVLSVNANQIIPPTANNTINTSAPVNNIPITQEPNLELKIDSSTPFDIGVTTQGPITSNPTLNSEIPANNNIPTFTSTETPMNSVTTNTASNSINNNSIPLTNDSINTNSNGENIVSVGKYLGNLILFSIPLIGFIMLLVKAFGNKNDQNISNLAKAQLLLALIIIILGVILRIIFSSLLAGIAPSTPYGI